MAEDKIKEIINKIAKFRDDRNWMQFHNPKDMAISIAIESSELLELFQWKSKKEIEKYLKENKNEIGEEIADVAIYLFELTDNLGFDLVEIINKKLEKNSKKYPTEKAKGVHTKYNKL